MRGTAVKSECSMKKGSSESIRVAEALRANQGDSEALGDAGLSLEQHDSFNRLITRISSNFIGARPSEIDKLIGDTLSTIGGFSKVERSYLLEFHKNGQVLDATHEWCAEGIPPQLGNRQNFLAKETLPWFSALADATEMLVVPDVSMLPPEAEAEKALLQGQGIRSLILVPMSSAGILIGYLGCECLDAPRTWDEETTALLQIVGQILLSAMSIKIHQEAMDRERSLMDTLMDFIPDRVYFKDSESKFIRISKSLAELFGLDHPAKAIGKTDFDFFTEIHAQQAYEDEQEIIQTGKPFVSQVERETWPGRPETWVSTTKMPLIGAKDKIAGTFGISRDVTEHKLMEDALEEHAALLEVANAELQIRNKELDEFSYAASHDLQEPLRKLIAYSDLLREDIEQGDQEEVQQDLEVMCSAATRMQSLVQGLLSLSRSGRQGMNIERLALNEVVDSALESLEISIDESSARIVRPELPFILGDRTLLTQLYQNLIGNAIKFGGTGPRVQMTAETNDAGQWILGVQDNGIGLKPEYSEQIFSPFKRLHGRTEYEGTGIGLAVCRKIIERHGGRIWVESQPDQGAHFRFTIGQSYEEEA
jgi:PAS domain S-box-containing protein